MSLGPDARALIEAASGGDEPASADAARVRSKIAERLALAAAAGTATTLGAKAAIASVPPGTAATAGAGAGAGAVLSGAAAGSAGVAGGVGTLAAKVLLAAAIAGG